MVLCNFSDSAEHLLVQHGEEQQTEKKIHVPSPVHPARSDPQLRDVLI